MISEPGILDMHTCDSFSQNGSFELLVAFRCSSDKATIVSGVGHHDQNIYDMNIDPCATLQKDTAAQALLAENPAQTGENISCSSD
jgi:hypothetical protein